MYLGTQVGARDDTDFKQWSQLGVANICSDPGGDPHSWTKDVLSKHREKIESFGLTLDMVQLPLSSTPIENSQSPNIMLGKSPERDREIESVQNLIKIISESEIPSAKYNMNIIGIPRSENEHGRGGSLNSTLRFEKIKNDDFKGKINVDIKEDNDYIFVKIIDNGVGFSLVDKAKMITPYFTTKKKGTGLGLAIVTKIINDHNSTILFNSIKDGAKIEVTIPKYYD